MLKYTTKSEKSQFFVIFSVFLPFFQEKKRKTGKKDFFPSGQQAAKPSGHLANRSTDAVFGIGKLRKFSFRVSYI